MPKSKKRVKDNSKHLPKPITLDVTNVRRSVKTFSIDSSKIVKSEWMTETDPFFLDLYTKYLRGRIPGYATRVPISMIKEGFYLSSRNFEYLCDAPPEGIILERVQDIREGRRPPLHLYANPNPNDTIRFLCPDDVVSCHAYKRLNLSVVPAIVFSLGQQPLPFSSFETKVNTKMSDMGPRVCGLKSAEVPTKLSSILGEVLPNDPMEGLQKLSHELSGLVARLRLFHLTKEGQLHYHHMVFSALIRLKETLQAIEILVEKSLWYQALALLRVLYEIHLNFYFDWLQPESSYRYLAAATVFSGSDVARQKLKMSQDLILNGLTQQAAEERANLAWKPVIFASTVSEKARLPKIGILYHKDIYNFLSQISHQDFEVASLHANRFDDEKFLAIDEEVKGTYLRFIDLIVSEFIKCIDDDIGTNHDQKEVL